MHISGKRQKGRSPAEKSRQIRKHLLMTKGAHIQQAGVVLSHFCGVYKLVAHYLKIKHRQKLLYGTA